MIAFKIVLHGRVDIPLNELFEPRLRNRSSLGLSAANNEEIDTTTIGTRPLPAKSVA
jgi:hypothetical protein